MKAFFASIIFQFILIGPYITTKDKMYLPGSIAVNYIDSVKIFCESDITSIVFPNDEHKITYGGFRWMNKTNKFIGIKYYDNEKSGIYRGDILIFDAFGKVFKTIYKAKQNEIASYAFLSNNDKFLLFCTENKGDVKLDPFEGLHRQKSIQIVDFETGILINELRNIGTSLELEIRESPWLYDESSFVFSIVKDKKIIIENEEVYASNKLNINGIYLYDLNLNKQKLLIPNGHFAICSPTDNRIAFIQDQSIYTYNLGSKIRNKIFEVESDDEIVNIHWTSDSKFIYIAYLKKKNNSFARKEKLIHIESNKEVNFRKIGHGFHPYTWK